MHVIGTIYDLNGNNLQNENQVGCNVERLKILVVTVHSKSLFQLVIISNYNSDLTLATYSPTSKKLSRTLCYRYPLRR